MTRALATSQQPAPVRNGVTTTPSFPNDGSRLPSASYRATALLVSPASSSTPPATTIFPSDCNATLVPENVPPWVTLPSPPNEGSRSPPAAIADGADTIRATTTAAVSDGSAHVRERRGGVHRERSRIVLNSSREGREIHVSSSHARARSEPGQKGQRPVTRGLILPSDRARPGYDRLDRFRRPVHVGAEPVAARLLREHRATELVHLGRAQVLERDELEHLALDLLGPAPPDADARRRPGRRT